MSGKSAESEYVSMNVTNKGMPYQGYTPEASLEGQEIRLPPELCEAIIDQIPTRDRHSLQNCALVCHLFALRAQRILFKSIVLNRPYKGFRWNVLSLRHPSRRFFTLINGSPHLGNYVEELEIADSAHLSFYREELSWIRQDLALPTIISRLDNLRHLNISGNHTGNRLNFNAWTEMLKSAILRKCQSPLLTKISLTYVRNVPISIFLQAPALESVHLFKSVCIVDEVPPVANQVDRPKLQEFAYTATTYYEWASFYPWLLNYEGGVDLTFVTSLSLHVDFSVHEGVEGDIDAIAWIVRQCAGTVEYLSLFYPPEAVTLSASNYTFLDLSTLVNLHTLSLQGNIWSPGGTGPQDSLPWLISTLSQIPSPTQLRKLHLLCTLEDSPFEWNSMLTIGDADWAGFVSVLEPLAAMAEVYILMSISDSRSKEAMMVIEDRLRRIRERGVVVEIQASLDSEELFDGLD